MEWLTGYFVKFSKTLKCKVVSMAVRNKRTLLPCQVKAQCYLHCPVTKNIIITINDLPFGFLDDITMYGYQPHDRSSHPDSPPETSSGEATIAI
jgi:hypothetical protein